MTATSDGERIERVDRLARARAADSAAKTSRSLAAIARAAIGGQPVTFTGIARLARVSTWFLYNKPVVRTALETAIADQQTHGIQASRQTSSTRVTPAALEAELAAAQMEIRQLRADRDRYRHRAQAVLGAEIDDMANQERLERARTDHRRIAELEAALQAATDRAGAAEQHRDELEDQLTASRANLKKLIRAVPKS